MPGRDVWGRPKEDVSLVTVTIEGYWPEGPKQQLPVSIGTKVAANFGALFPRFEGMVTEIDEEGWVTIENPDGEDHACKADEILPYGAVSANGSPIGVFLVEPPTLPRDDGHG
ncbi:MAG: hypothetical protein AAF566_13750 [Pseudomonadota bacterium]